MLMSTRKDSRKRRRCPLLTGSQSFLCRFSWEIVPLNGRALVFLAIYRPSALHTLFTSNYSVAVFCFGKAQPMHTELIKKILGNKATFSPIVTLEPRRRKFHKPITMTIPVPKASSDGIMNGYGGDTPTLRLLCSITGRIQILKLFMCILILSVTMG